MIDITDQSPNQGTVAMLRDLLDAWRWVECRLRETL